MTHPCNESVLRSRITELLQSSLDFHLQGNQLRAMNLADDALSAAEQANHCGLETRALIMKRYIHTALGEYKTAAALLKTIMENLSVLDNEEDLGFTHRTIGIYYLEQCKHIQAIEYLFKAKLNFERSANAKMVGCVFHNIGNTLCSAGNYQKSLQYYFQATQIFESNNYTSEAASVYADIGATYNAILDNKKAYYWYNKALEQFRQLRSTPNIAFTLGRVGKCLHSLQQYQEAQEALVESLRLLETLNNQRYVVVTLIDIASLYTTLKQFDKAELLLQQAHIMAVESTIVYDQSRSLLASTELEMARGRYEYALEYLQGALALHKDTDALGQKLYMLTGLADCYMAIGKEKEALAYHIEQRKLYDQILHLERVKAITSVEIEQTIFQLEKRYDDLEQRVTESENELRKKNAELEDMALHLSQKTKALEQVQHTVKQFLRPSKGKANALALHLIQAVSAKGAATYLHSDAHSIESQHRDFFAKMHTMFPTLTPAEIKVCLLITQQYSTKQIADLLCASELTIKTHRTHIRRKLNIDASDNLYAFLVSM